MARYLPVQKDAATDAVRAVYTSIEKRLNGMVPNFFKVIASSASFLEAFQQMYRTLMVESCSVNDKIRTLAALKVSKTNKCPYFTALTTEWAKTVGITDGQIKAVDDHEKSDSFTYDEKLVLSYSEMVAKDPGLISDDFFKFLKNHYTQQQVTELTLISAFTGMINRFCKALEIDIEKK